MEAKERKRQKSSRKHMQNLTTVALMTAVMCILSPISFAVGPVPISLGTFVLYLCVYMFGAWKSTASVCVYLIMGFAGVPVFVGYTAGVGKLLGPTGGYLVGYIFVTLIGGLMLDKIKRNLWLGILWLVVSTVVLYAFGTVWYLFLMGGSVKHALMICVVPFIPLDCVKIAAAVFVGDAARKRLLRAGVMDADV